MEILNWDKDICTNPDNMGLGSVPNVNCVFCNCSVTLDKELRITECNYEAKK